MNKLLHSYYSNTFRNFQLFNLRQIYFPFFICQFATIVYFQFETNAFLMQEMNVRKCSSDICSVQRQQKRLHCSFDYFKSRPETPHLAKSICNTDSVSRTSAGSKIMCCVNFDSIWENSRTSWDNVAEIQLNCNRNVSEVGGSKIVTCAKFEFLDETATVPTCDKTSGGPWQPSKCLR